VKGDRLATTAGLVAQRRQAVVLEVDDVVLLCPSLQPRGQQAAVLAGVGYRRRHPKYLVLPRRPCVPWNPSWARRIYRLWQLLHGVHDAGALFV
jgi:hypothetical protein